MHSQADNDARIALGVRPGFRPSPRVIIDESPLEEVVLLQADADADPHPPHSPLSRHVSLAVNDLSGSTTLVTSSASTEPVRRFRRPTLSRKLQPTNLTANRGLHETQKLLSHLIDRIEARVTAPDILDRAVIAARALNGRTRVKGKNKVKRLGHAVVAATQSAVGTAGSNRGPSSLIGNSSEDFTEPLFLEEGDWDTNETYDLVEQLRDLLILADRQGLDLFGSSATVSEQSIPSSKVKGKRGRFASVSPLHKPPAVDLNADRPGPTLPLLSISGPALLARLTHLLRPLITVDGIHKTQRFHLLRPPYALQAACLDLASILYHKADLLVKLTLMDIVIDGLYSMGDVMCERICEWLEGRLGELLNRLARERGDAEDDSLPMEWNDPFAIASTASPTIPTFAFSPDTSDLSEHPKQSPGWIQYSPKGSQSPAFTSSSHILGILPTHATSGVISTAAIQIGGLIPRVLIALTSTVDLRSAKLTTVYRTHRLLSLILTAKPDASLDLLEIVAHGSLENRRRAMNILATFYPNSMGHNVVARRPALSTYLAHRTKWETGQERALAEDDVESHCYIPWRANPTTGLTCTTCQMTLKGFCVRCVLCQGVRHLGCLSLLGDQVFEFEVIVLASVTSTPTVVRIKFSKCVPRLDEQVLHGGLTRDTANSTQRIVGQHQLHLVNLFTLTLCHECYEPLWGTTAQAYACMGGCQRLYHPKCAVALYDRGNAQCRFGREVVIDDISGHGKDPFTISTSSMRSSFDQSEQLLFRKPVDLHTLSYDETAFIYGNLVSQYELCENGMSAGTIRVSSEDMSSVKNDALSLLPILKLYEDHLLATRATASTAVMDFLNATGTNLTIAHDLIWQPRYLTYCAALLRAPTRSHFGHPPHSFGDLLTVGTPGSPNPQFDEDTSHTAYVAVRMSTFRNSLLSDMNVGNELAASIILDQLKYFGHCSSPEYLLGIDAIRDGNSIISFALPLLMDSSPAVEFLVLAIEALLDDLDLTSNEQALILLCNRAWPSTLCSPYALERLGAAVLFWVMSEDDVLHQVVKTFASKRRRLPGVRSAAGVIGAVKGTSSVGMYKSDRSKLLERYAKPWLAALHDLDSALYTNVAYEQSKATINRQNALDLSDQIEAPQIASLVLEKLTSLADSKVIFSSSLELLTAWLEDLGALVNNDVVYKSLPRLLRHDIAREGLINDTENLWILSKLTSEQGPDGLQRVCRWMRVLASSGVEVPWAIITSMINLQATIQSSTETRFDLVTAINANIMPIEPALFADLGSQMIRSFATSIEGRSASTLPSKKEIDLLKMNMLTILRAFGTSLEDISTTSLYMENITGKLSHTIVGRRHVNDAPPALHSLDPETVIAVTGILRHNFPADMILDFLWLLFTKSPLVENVDGFLHQISLPLYEIIWPLYDQVIERRSRARVFLKLLTVSAAPVEQITVDQLKSIDRTLIRERLLVFILELADQNVSFEVAGWRRSSVGLILIFFDVILQPNDLEPENLVVRKALLPVHLQTISACFEEHLVACSNERRQFLLARLRHMQMLIPSWPVLGWKALEEFIAEEVANIQQLSKAETIHAQSALYDAQRSRASLLTIGLGMFAAGIECDWAIMQRFQQHIAFACAMPWQIPVENITEVIIPALKQILDSTARVAIRSSHGEDKHQKKALVGSSYLSVVIDFVNELCNHDFLVQRYILDILLIVFFKHNVRPVELSALSALQTLVHFIANTNCVENRLLAVQILQTAQSRMHKDVFIRVLPTLFIGMADIMVAERSSDGDPAIAEQCRTFLQSTINQYGRAGLFLQVLRTDGLSTDSTRNPEALGRALQVIDSEDQSTKKLKTDWFDQVILNLPDVLKRGRQALGQVLMALSRMTETLEYELSEENVHGFGSFIGRLSKHIGEWDSPHDFDPDPVLDACSIVLKLSPTSSSITLLHQTSTFLHLALSRFAVHHEPISGLLLVSDRISRQNLTENTISTVLFELSGAAINGLPIVPTTLVTLLTFLTHLTHDVRRGAGTDRTLLLRVLTDASSGCLGLLLRVHPTVPKADTETGMKILNGAAEIIVLAEIEAPGNAARVLNTLPSEAAIIQLEVFIHVLYASLNVVMGLARRHLIALYPLLGRATSLSLRACSDLLSVPDPGGDGAQLASAVYTAFRLVVLAVHDCHNEGSKIATSEHQDAMRALAAFWDRIWPDWYRLLSMSLDYSCINIPLRSIAHSVLLDMIIVVAQAQPSLLVEHSSALSSSLHLLEEWYATSGTAAGSPKLTKALALLEGAALHVPDVQAAEAITSRTIMIKTIWTDMVATERLKILRTSGYV